MRDSFPLVVLAKNEIMKNVAFLILIVVSIRIILVCILFHYWGDYIHLNSFHFNDCCLMAYKNNSGACIL